jgi:hypothetical protein
MGLVRSEKVFDGTASTPTPSDNFPNESATTGDSVSKVERARRCRNDYKSYRDLLTWDIIRLENEGVLKWRFRPRYIDRRVKRAIAALKVHGV